MSKQEAGKWWDISWNPVVGCSPVSPACDSCYAARLAATRLAHLPAYAGLTTPEGRWTGEVRLLSERLEQPLHWRKPRRVFCCDMSDLFHPEVPDDYLDAIFGMMSNCDQHQFHILTKRPARMRDYLASDCRPNRIAREMDSILVKAEMAKVPLIVKDIEGYPGYMVDNRGTVYSSSGSGVCPHCGGPVPPYAKRKYCSRKCRQNGQYRMRAGKPRLHEETPKPLKVCEIGKDGHYRIMLYANGKPRRELIHRLVLAAFDRPPEEGEQACHRDGDPTNNHIANLRWGSQSDNWDDRRRHGNGRSYAKLSIEDVRSLRAQAVRGESITDLASQYEVSYVQVRNILTGRHWRTDSLITWPPPNVLVGVTAENQEQADARIPTLLYTPAAHRFVSVEPMLSAVSIPEVFLRKLDWGEGPKDWPDGAGVLEWVVCGGETGPNARPCSPEWIRSIVAQCKDAGVPVFVKAVGRGPIGDGINIQEMPE